MKTILVMVEIEVPEEATEKDIKDFVDVEYGHVNSMKSDNPCRGDAAEILGVSWAWEAK